MNRFFSRSILVVYSYIIFFFYTNSYCLPDLFVIILIVCETDAHKESSLQCILYTSYYCTKLATISKEKVCSF